MTVSNLRTGDNEVRNLRNQNAQLNQRLAEANAKAQSCNQQVTFLMSVQANLDKAEKDLETSSNQITLLRNQLAMSNNEASKCQLEVAQVAELERRLKN